MDECVAVAVVEAVAEAVTEAVAEADQSIHDQSIRDPPILPRSKWDTDLCWTQIYAIDTNLCWTQI